MASRAKECVYSDRTLRRQAIRRAEQHLSTIQVCQDEDARPYEHGEDAHAEFNSVSSHHHDGAGATFIDHVDDYDMHDDDMESQDVHTAEHSVSCSNGGDDNETESDQTDDDSDTEDDDFASQLKEWVLQSGLPLIHGNSLLSILRPHFPFLPKDIRTLLQTQRTYSIDEVAGGQYHHFGIRSGLRNRLVRDQTLLSSNEILIQINVDGLPLYKSSTESFWPILGLLSQEHNPEPFVIGLWVGISKPKDTNEYIKAFVDEMVDIEANGIIYDDKTLQVKIENFVCDTPARAFLKRTKGHTGYFGCDHCEQSGVWLNHRMSFPEKDAPPRSDVRFDEMAYEDHQLGESSLNRLNLGMVSQFPHDYMHLVCLGVVKRLITMWISGPLHVRLGGRMISCISDKVNAMKDYLPREFLRKGRSLQEVERWKATEFRTFLLYTGPVVLRDLLTDCLYDNFMLLFVGITILCSADLSSDYCDFADEILGLFVNHFSSAYGPEYVVYNIHGLVHLGTHVKRFGSLHRFSSFPFENYLKTLKKMVRKPSQPLPQAIRRITEKLHIIKAVHAKDIYCKGKHNRGPLLEDMEATECVQYRELHMVEYVLRTKRPDNAIQVQDDICIIRNIVTHNGTRKIVCQKFRAKDNFFTYPVNSSRLNIWFVHKVNQHLFVISPEQISSKMVLLPYKDGFIAIPLL